jgi:hypothetical protein
MHAGSAFGRYTNDTCRLRRHRSGLTPLWLSEEGSEERYACPTCEGFQNLVELSQDRRGSIGLDLPCLYQLDEQGMLSGAIDRDRAAEAQAATAGTDAAGSGTARAASAT